MGMILLIVLYWSGFFAAFYKASYAISVINKLYGLYVILSKIGAYGNHTPTATVEEEKK